MIGYLVKGPVSIEGKSEAAIAAALAWNELLQDAATGAEDIDPAVVEALDASGQEVEDLLVTDPAKFVADFIEFWANGARDANSRTDPDDPTQLLVFAGEGTWGGEPEGYGYKLIRDAERCGILAAFGIR